MKLNISKYLKLFFLLQKINSFINTNSNSSGATFYTSISAEINKIKLKNNFILMNIDAPLYIVFFSKIINRKIALRIDGFTPAAAILLLGHIKRSKFKATA